MQVILLEKIAKLGDFGDTVKVRSGYGRNYLIPYGKALTATKENLQYFSDQREELERKREEKRQLSLSRAEKLEGVRLRTEANASEDGKLYGSITVRDIANLLAEQNIKIEKRELTMPEDHLRYTGEYTITVTLEGEKVIEIPLEITASAKTTAH